MSLPVFSKSLIEAIGVSDRAVFDYATLVRLLRAIEARLMPLEDQSGSLEEAIEAVRKVGLDRINEVLTPAIQLILEFQSKGFLVARSSTAATLGNGNILTLIIGDEQGRAVFTPAPFIALTREANADDYAICRTISYVQEDGVLICEVVSFAGAAGPHSDWVIGALAGSTIAQQTMLAAAQALLGDTQDARDAAMGYRNQAASHVTSAADEKDLAIAARNAAEGFAGAAAGARNTALTYRDQAAASASIAASAAGQALDVLDRVDIPASLVLDFTDPKGAPYKGNFTRATGGGYARKPNGLWVPTGNNEPVIDYAADGKPKGTGFFGAYTNLLRRSEEFDNAAWVKSNATVVPNSAVGPDGAATMDKLVENSSNIGHAVSQAVTGSNAIFTASVFAKAGERSSLMMQLNNNGSGAAFAVFNLTDGTVGAPSNGGDFTGAVARIEPCGNGIYRCSFTATKGTFNTVVSAQLNLHNGTTQIYLGDGASGLYIWGAQLTQTAFPVPYVPTTSAAVTRNADNMVIGGADFTDFFNPAEGAIYASCFIPSAGLDANVWQIDAGAVTDRLLLRRNADGTLGCFSIVGSVQQVGLNLGAVTPGAVARVAFSWAAGAFRASLNGNAAVTTASGTLPSVNQFRVGSSVSAQPFNSYIRRLIYWPKALGATDLQRTTA